MTRPNSHTLPAMRHAMATPSYHGDFERCRLLCESVDRFVTGLSMHYLLVNAGDAEMFRSLEGPYRRVMTDAQLLPPWLKAWRDPFSGGKRLVWTGAGAILRRVPPLRGWHVQQLLKMALPEVISEDVILYADSDVTFLKPYDLTSQDCDGKIRLFRQPKGVTPGMPHVKWAEAAAISLGVPASALPADDYITSLVTWRRETAVAMLRHIEKNSGRHWIPAVTHQRGFSEWMLYGMFNDIALKVQPDHFHDPLSLAHVVWFEKDVPPAGLGDLRKLLEPGQVAIGIQSFIGFPTEEIRRYLEADVPAL
jgi:hypothetical protein